MEGDEKMRRDEEMKAEESKGGLMLKYERREGDARGWWWGAFPEGG